MIKECIVLNDEVINIGPWDYKLQQVLVSPAEYNDEGKTTKEAVYEEQTMNPLPEGATIEEREIEVAPDGGLIVKGSAQPTSDELLGQELAQIKLQSMQQQELLSNMGAELAAARLEIISLKGESGS
ncbi:phage-like element PBSX protein xkdW [Paenibacillus polymyxa M1]|uniref:XkdW family protein n=1 Tax=Paenibacillus polymyxa TaxID=1406 RepID=UPI00021BBDD8|nr:XkdW family protein [Paenibacillus polymyxa]CCC85688.1 phage-like element PBSX protein xkdW [Paenibacillus polymyxa M1]